MRGAPILDSPGSCGESARAYPALPVGRPIFPLRIFHVQNLRNALRCQATTVTGLTMIKEDRQFRQTNSIAVALQTGEEQ
jgi:hypothetical protein